MARKSYSIILWTDSGDDARSARIKDMVLQAGQELYDQIRQLPLPCEPTGRIDRVDFFSATETLCSWPPEPVKDEAADRHQVYQVCLGSAWLEEANTRGFITFDELAALHLDGDPDNLEYVLELLKIMGISLGDEVSID